MRIFPPLFVGALLVTATGCSSTPPDNATKLVKLDAEPNRDTDLARSLNQKAAGLIAKSDFSGAEKLLKQAVAADSEFGPAQNNLGVVYFNESKLYPAAQQFLLAAALMPHDPESRNSLGLVFESSNRFDDAIRYFDRALALDPENCEYLGNAARAHIRHGDQTDEVLEMLRTLAANDTRPEWNQWAWQTLHHFRRFPSTDPGLPFETR